MLKPADQTRIAPSSWFEKNTSLVETSWSSRAANRLDVAAGDAYNWCKLPNNRHHTLLKAALGAYIVQRFRQRGVTDPVEIAGTQLLAQPGIHVIDPVTQQPIDKQEHIDTARFMVDVAQLSDLEGAGDLRRMYVANLQEAAGVEVGMHRP